MKKVYLYILGLLILGIILLFVFTAISKNHEIPPVRNNLGIYTAVDNSVDNYLNKTQSKNQEKNIYDAVDASVNQSLNK